MKTVKKKNSELVVCDILSVAPNEGEFPRDPSADLMGDIMVFPGVYGGRSRSTPIQKMKKEEESDFRRFIFLDVQKHDTGLL